MHQALKKTSVLPHVSLLKHLDEYQVEIAYKLPHTQILLFSETLHQIRIFIIRIQV
jgi:hypothetical protein